jgi:tartrate dehydratase beta subunit/fumarate hydratase class I family protein
LGTVTARKVTPAKEPNRNISKGPQTRGSQKKAATKVIDAGGNTGFGIKGNTFVGGPEERAVMMKYYGGTGSAATKAAQEGKQGKLKELGMESLKKEMQEARAKRFAREKDNRNKGGVIKKAVGSMDFRMGGTVLSTVDRRRMK